VIVALIDPNADPLRAAPRDERDLAIAAANRRVLAFDNLSGIPPWLSDAFCRLATGGAVGTRKLYEDDEEVVFDAKRPVILNGIHHLINRLWRLFDDVARDLLDRSLCVQPPLLSRQSRRAEQDLWEAFERARPAIFGALLRAVSGALSNVDHVRLDELPRMADLAIWITAAEPALGWPPGTFLRAYAKNESEADARVVEAESLAVPSSTS
jgi:hypothetical protein